MNEKSPRSCLKKNHRAKATRFSLTLPGNTLFNDASAQIRINQALFGIHDRFTQSRIADT
jgi:hypothetical protein